MARNLVVAHQTLTNPVLLQELKKIEAKDKSAEFTLLVPATPIRHLPFRQGRRRKPEWSPATWRRRRKEFESKHVNLVSARVGAESPAEAIDNEVKADPGYAGFVISTLAQEKSRWLRLDLPNVVQAKYGLPVSHVEAPIDFLASQMP